MLTYLQSYCNQEIQKYAIYKDENSEFDGNSGVLGRGLTTQIPMWICISTDYGHPMKA